ncbi:hypothetical protein ABIF21_005909 [Bradyrhizobium elkanii]|uniref:hypothetical protein n=1 Tax=Bradyrhizobium elkanii TaxID=29448 RepID=UPI0010214CD8|nr:hypothetical protein [Bradyrhizobium elkanii]MCW2113708.1 hypothetical protein [Bradyrhizobium elkanii]MCW2197940.1 hypothetical protein [Bradyrhizobium elkanii]MCW2230514.1 hypothetical protein [Bradyrhizobium elkanii]NWL40510.1 hypothetical protein [Bradyrhizobium elkanii]RYM34336.1 hypothetical protein EWH13_00220 [Bradyrhizobium elkanii]
MDPFIARANIDHCLDLLKASDTPDSTKATVTKVLIEEERKLGHEREQLEFAESRAMACRERAERQRRLKDSFEPGSLQRRQAESLLISFEWLAKFIEGACVQMRRKADGGLL